MLINKKIILTSVVGLAVGMSSCKKYLDVNTNPNVAQSASVETLLPAAQLYIGTALGVDLQIDGGIWAQYWTQTPIASQYNVFEQYAPGQDAFYYPWSNLYQGAENFYQISKISDSLKKKGYSAISLLMRAYTFQLLTDGWGDIPFTQALKGQYVDGHLVNPKYDSQRVVYNGIIAYIDSANKLMAAGGAWPGKDDLIYGGFSNNNVEWQKFSNTLKLKVCLRMAKIDPVRAQALIDTLYSTSPAFIGEGDDAMIKYGANSSNKSPLYAEESSATLANVQNLAGSSTCIDSMNSNGDPRAYLFYNALSNGSVSGITQGASIYDASVSASTYSIPSYFVAGDANNALSANAPVFFLTSWESFFLQAEVVARGWQPASSGLTDNALFYNGIKASFDFDYYKKALPAIWDSLAPGVTADPYTDYITTGIGTASGTAPGYWTVYPAAGSVEDKVRFIITQKWFAMCGNQGFEAWTEWRRTGYPDFLVHPKSSLIGNLFPRRFLYPTTESTANVSFPGLQPLTSKVWWDVL